MSEYSTPGVYIEEFESGLKPIEGVSTDITGILGQTERGPIAVRYITRWIEFQSIYGGYSLDKSYLASAVEGFFENGGQRCYIGRIIHPNATHAYTVLDDKLVVSAIGPGEWGKNISLEFEGTNSGQTSRSSDLKGKRKKLMIECGDYQEEHEVMNYEIDSINCILTKINQSSKLIRVWRKKGQIPNTFSEDLGQISLDQGGSDGGKVKPEHFKGSTDLVTFTGPNDLEPNPKDELFGRGSGLKGLTTVEDISLLVIPDEVQPGFEKLTKYAIQYCEKEKYCFAIVSAPKSAKDVNEIKPPQETNFAAYYYPWIEVFDGSIDQTRIVPPSGHIAGIYARADHERGVWKAPANEVVRGAVSLQISITQEDQDILNPKGVNCIRNFRSEGRGLRVWGARTMSNEPEYRYIPVRRLMIFIEESIDRGTKWVVFEPNNEALWEKVRQVVSVFLMTQWRAGALAGTTAEEAFFIKCDRTTMTQDDIDNGCLICIIGIAPVKPAEFIVFRITQITSRNLW